MDGPFLTLGWALLRPEIGPSRLEMNPPKQVKHSFSLIAICDQGWGFIYFWGCTCNPNFRRCNPNACECNPNFEEDNILVSEGPLLAWEGHLSI